MNMRRTAKLKIKVTEEQKAILHNTVQVYSACFNRVARVAWDNHDINGVSLHHKTYYPLRAEHPTLPAQLVCSARQKAREAVASTFARKRKGKKTGCPQAKGVQAMRYDARSSHLWLDDQRISLSTTGGRLKFSVVIPDYFIPMLENAEGIGSIDLVSYPNGTFWLHVATTIPRPPVEANGHIVGVDVGISRIAVTSNGQFFDGKHTKEHARKLFRLRRALQAKGTKSAKRHLRKLRRRENRFRTDVNHRVSKLLVNSLPPGSTIVMENLTDIRKRVKARRKQRRELHNWSFAQFQTFVAYKAETRGINVVFADARYTSQCCSRCGYISRSNRRSQSWFHCRKCGYQANADYNAAKNLAQRGMSALGGRPVNSPIVPPDEAEAHQGIEAEGRHKLPDSSGE